MPPLGDATVQFHRDWSAAQQAAVRSNGNDPDGSRVALALWVEVNLRGHVYRVPLVYHGVPLASAQDLSDSIDRTSSFDVVAGGLLASGLGPKGLQRRLRVIANEVFARNLPVIAGRQMEPVLDAAGYDARRAQARAHNVAAIEGGRPDDLHLIVPMADGRAAYMQGVTRAQIVSLLQALPLRPGVTLGDVLRANLLDSVLGVDTAGRPTLTSIIGAPAAPTSARDAAPPGDNPPRLPPLDRPSDVFGPPGPPAAPSPPPDDDEENSNPDEPRTGATQADRAAQAWNVYQSAFRTLQGYQTGGLTATDLRVAQNRIQAELQAYATGLASQPANVQRAVRALHEIQRQINNALAVPGSATDHSLSSPVAYTERFGLVRFGQEITQTYLGSQNGTPTWGLLLGDDPTPVFTSNRPITIDDFRAPDGPVQQALTRAGRDRGLTEPTTGATQADRAAQAWNVYQSAFRTLQGYQTGGLTATDLRVAQNRT